MDRNIRYIEDLIKEMGNEKAKEEYLEWCFYLLDNFAKNKKNEDIFHLTADECVSADEEEIDNTIDFITKYRNEVEGELLGELFDYILETMRRKSNYYPYMILGEFFDEVTKN